MGNNGESGGSGNAGCVKYRSGSSIEISRGSKGCFFMLVETAEITCWLSNISAYGGLTKAFVHYDISNGSYLRL